VDIKGFNKKIYSKLAHVANFEAILEATIYAKNILKMHVEVITLVIPGWNDDKKQLSDIAKWIKQNLGVNTAWHVTRFAPYLELSDIHSTPIETLEQARIIGYEEGLQYVYIGNVQGHTGENTYCPKCDNVLIARIGYQTHIKGLDGNKCAKCGNVIPIVF
jgi:pyruvate formate lyase activating enzyme